MSARHYLRALVAIALANYALIPLLMTAASLIGLLPAMASAAYLPPATALVVAFGVAFVVYLRCLETGASRAWTLPVLLWVATSSAFQPAAPVSLVAFLASGHAIAGVSMVSQAIAPLAVLVFLALYRPASRRWLGQRLVSVAVAGAVVADLVMQAPRMLAVAGGWLNLMALANPELSGLSGNLMLMVFAFTKPVAALGQLDQTVAVFGLPVHMVVLVGGLVMLAVEGDWGPSRHEPLADTPALR